MGADTFRSGDRVRVTFEATVEYKKAFGGFVFKPVNGGNLVSLEDTADLSIEKVEPPVEVFGPGNFVRVIGSLPDKVVALGRKGYINEDGEYFARSPEWMQKEFTSKYYERVDFNKLAEAPF